MAAAEHDLVAVAERPERVHVRARVDEHAASRGERVVRALVTGAQHPQARRVAPQRRILEQKVVGEREDRAVRAQVIVDRERDEEALARQQASAVIADQQHRATRRDVLHPQGADPEVVRAKQPPQIAQQGDELGVPRTHVIRGRLARDPDRAAERELREPRGQARRRQQDPAIRGRNQPPGTLDPVTYLGPHAGDGRKDRAPPGAGSRWMTRKGFAESFHARTTCVATPVPSRTPRRSRRHESGNSLARCVITSTTRSPRT
ncbi:MAG: hypothetical protein H6Q90_415 [Deltaproteobacteria bacterium]|nr:hypothetical protein [Deltaproteobacteria bacterium]